MQGIKPQLLRRPGMNMRMCKWKDKRQETLLKGKPDKITVRRNRKEPTVY